MITFILYVVTGIICNILTFTILYKGFFRALKAITNSKYCGLKEIFIMIIFMFLSVMTWPITMIAHGINHENVQKTIRDIIITME